MEVKPMIDFTW